VGLGWRRGGEDQVQISVSPPVDIGKWQIWSGLLSSGGNWRCCSGERSSAWPRAPRWL